MNTPERQTARSTADQVAELKALRSEHAVEAARAIEAEAARRAREIVTEQVEERRHRTMVWLTAVSVFFAAVAAVAAVVVLVK